MEQGTENDENENKGAGSGEPCQYICRRVEMWRLWKGYGKKALLMGQG
jgi:hypothetical protein